MRDEREHLRLFDLIAREWRLASTVDQIVFGADDGAVAFASADGRVHLAATADPFAPGKRIRRAVDDGRLTIAPRDRPAPPLKAARATRGRSSPVVPQGASGFAFGTEAGRINRLSPSGVAGELSARAPGPIRVLDASPDGRTLAYASGSEILVTPGRGEPPRRLPAPGPVAGLAFSPDGGTLAVAHEDGLDRWDLGAPEKGPLRTAIPGRPCGVAWRRDGAWLVARLDAGGFCVVEAASNLAHVHGNFPAPVRQAEFSLPTGTVVASGAFRAAAWWLADQGDVRTGQAGLVLVDALAACPSRNLVAVGYANGLVSLAEIGRPSEILLREDTGAGISAMAWSSNGAYLALAGADGSAALVEFPDVMFKS